MEKWQEKYKAKICSPDEAIQKIKSVKRISFGHICSESSVLTEALIRNKKLFKKLEIDHLLSIGKCEYAKEENSEYFHHNALFIGPKTREAANSSYGDYTPIFFYETAKIFGKDGDLSLDAMLLKFQHLMNMVIVVMVFHVITLNLLLKVQRLLLLK